MEITSVSFIVLAYNQEQYIREAVKSAFAQTYIPLEIFISDDCSQDKTFDIILDECNKYDGCHEVVVNRNETNLGIVRHLNKTIRMTKGDLIVIAAGDDISNISRTQRMIEIWNNGTHLIIGCNPRIINMEGKTIGCFYSRSIPNSFDWHDIIFRRNTGIFLSAFDRKIFKEWGELDESLLMEDQSIPFRAALMQKNTIKVIDEKLVNYRVHNQSLVSNYLFSTPGQSFYSTFVNKLTSQIVTHRSWFEDLYRANYSHICKKDKLEYLLKLKNRLSFFLQSRRIISTNGFSDRMNLWKVVRKSRTVRGLNLLFLLILASFPNITINAVSIIFYYKNRIVGRVRGY